jgi:hypothetical protein
MSDAMTPEEVRLAAAALNGFLEASDRVDRFATWLLAGAGAAVGLLIAHYGDLANLIPSHTLSRVLLAFFLLTVFAAVEKVLAVAVETGKAAAAKTLELMPRSGEQIRDVVVVTALTVPLFGPLRWLARRAWSRGVSDPLLSLKGAVKLVQWQSVATLLEVVAFLVGLGCLTWGMSHRETAGTISGTVGLAMTHRAR